MSTPPAGWYEDPTDASRLRYWDGSAWTDHHAVRQEPGAPQVTRAPYREPINVYDNAVDLTQALDADQLERYMHNTLKRFPTWLVVVLHILTLGIFTVFYQGMKLSKLPLVRHNDFTAAKGIGFNFIPFFNLYWVFRFVLAVTDRLNFQFRLRGQPPPISRELALASCILHVIPYLNVLSWLILEPIVAGQWQSATNRLVKHWPQPPDQIQEPLPAGAERA